jgi:lysophospholipase L1-like esterase
MKRLSLFALTLTALLGIASLALHSTAGRAEAAPVRLFAADDPLIQYTGRVDFTNPKLPKFWSPGVYIRAKFEGSDCAVVVNDEVLWGKSHNYLEIAVDNQPPIRVQTQGASNTIPVAQGLSPGAHTVTICKDTEAGIGYLQFVGFRCQKLLPLPSKPVRKMEFIGDSITCGADSDLSEKPCGQGEWYDQHNAYLSYGPTTARILGAQWQLTSVSGIGLMHSCCGMTITMPQVFGQMNLSNKADGTWDFERYQPDAVTICLGQNDGIQDPKTFDDAYVAFIAQVRAAYPNAQIICLSSPMADASLTAYLKTHLTQIVSRVTQSGNHNVHTYFFSRSYNGGCDGHPDVAQHRLIAEELSAALKPMLHW